MTYDEKRTDARRKQRRQRETGSVHCRTVRGGYLNPTEEGKLRSLWDSPCFCNTAQFPVGKTHTGTDRWGNTLGFKTIITSSKEAVKRHIHELKLLIRKNAHASQGQLIKELNQVIHGWTNYYRSMVATESFHHCRYILFQQLHQWAKRRHPHKGKTWISNHYWHVDERRGWHFTGQR